MRGYLPIKDTYSVTPSLIVVRVRQRQNDLGASGDADIPGDGLTLVVTEVNSADVA